ncbi:MAG: LysE family translocator [Pseudomonadales bacterium]|nr:LysE family translocator [Pseudomonadales bacterium]
MDQLLPLLLFCFIATITPGPNNVMLLASGLNFGVRRTLPHLLGICIGFPLMVILVGFGFGLIFNKYPVLHDLIKIVGTFYLLYLAWLIANASAGEDDPVQGKPITFLQSATFQWVNPKAWVMISGAVAAFTVPNANIYFQVLIIALCFMLVAFPCAGIWAVFGSSLQQILKTPSWRRMFNYLMALLLVLSLLPVLRSLFN